MIRRITQGLIAIVLVGAVAGVSGCQPKVEVRSGEVVECRYGHTVRNKVNTLRVPSRDASKYQVKRSVIVCPRHERAERLYAEAQKALAKDDAKTAKAKLEAVAALDPAFGKAKSQLEQIAQGKTPVPDLSTSAGSSGVSGSSGSSSSGTNSKSKPKPAPKPVGPVLSLTRWVPESLSGFATGVTSADALIISREYLPKSGSMEALIISAEQFASKESANSALAEQKARYPKNAKTVTVGGRKSYVGTDGGEFAQLVFTEGQILVVLEGHAKGDAAPEGLIDDLTGVAGKLPAPK
ncbi:MAG: hypothetical protein HY876_10630 [Coriobacteriales bacterium]|nr:hypothetical protein [Coriobacteriales bacterium]